MNTLLAHSRLNIRLIALGAFFTAIAASHAADATGRVDLIRVPGASRLMQAQRSANGTIHLVYDAYDGPRYVQSDDGGATFSAPLALVDRAARKPGLEYITWDLAVGPD